MISLKFTKGCQQYERSVSSEERFKLFIRTTGITYAMSNRGKLDHLSYTESRVIYILNVVHPMTAQLLITTTLK